jgi:tripartite-type tricarboxylate transporter receptor subunit TctC
MLVPNPPGGATDTLARVIAPRLAETNRLLCEPDLRDRLRNVGGLEPFVTTADEFSAMIRSDYAKYGPVVKAAGATVD